MQSQWLELDARYTVIQGEDWWIDLYRDENVQIITVNEPLSTATGTFTLAFRGQTTVPIDIEADAAAVEAALASLPTIGAGNVAVTGTAGSPWTVTWKRTLASAKQPLLVPIWTFDTTDSSVDVGYVPHDVSGYTAAAKVKDAPASGGTTTYASVTETSGTDGQVVLSDGANGHVTVKIKAATTATWTFKKAQLDVQLITAGGIKEHWLSADVTLRQSVLV